MLIPIIIMVVVTLTANIIAGVTYIGVESLSIDKTYLELIHVDQIYYASDLLLPKVSPSRATNKTITWEIEDITLLDASYDDSVVPAVTLIDAYENPVETNTTGVFKVNAYCSFELSAQAETKKATCMVFVGGDDVRSITISYGDMIAEEIKVGDSLKLSYSVVPISAKIEDMWWETSNANVAVVDENGVVTVTGKGTAEITLSIRKYVDNWEYVTSNVFVVTGKEGASYYGSTFNSALRTLSLSTIGAKSVTSVTGGSISGDTLTITGDSCTLQTANGPLTINICEEGDLEIVHADLFKVGSGYILGLDEKLTLKARWADVFTNTACNPTWTVSGGDFTIENGVLKATKVGTATVTATVGSKSKSIQVQVEDKLTNLMLSTTNSTLKVGIARETVFASAKYKDDLSGTENNSFEIKFSSPAMPEDPAEVETFINKFNYSVSDTSKAYFEGNILYFNKDAITEKCELTVTVSAKYHKYRPEYTTRSFTLKVINGVAVYTEPQLQKACDDNYNISLMENVSGIHQYYCLNKDLYGNDHMINLNMNESDKHDDCIFLVKRANTISNVTLRANETDGEMSSEDGSKSFLGGCIQYEWDLDRDNPTYDVRFASTLESSIVENCSINLRMYGVDILMNGVVVRNSSQVAMHTRNRLLAEKDGVRYYEYTNLTINNCIFSNLLGTCANMEYQDSFFLPDAEGDECGAMDDHGNSIYTPTYEVERNSTLRQTGFVDIYNWQSIYDVTGLISGFAIDDSLKIILGPLIQALFEYDDFNNFKITTGSGTGQTQQYIHMGFLSNGIMNPSVLDATFEDSRMKYLDLEKCPSVVSEYTYNRFLIQQKTMLFIYDNTADIRPDDKPIYDKYTFNRLNPKK